MPIGRWSRNGISLSYGGINYAVSGNSHWVAGSSDRVTEASETGRILRYELTGNWSSAEGLTLGTRPYKVVMEAGASSASILGRI